MRRKLSDLLVLFFIGIFTCLLLQPVSSLSLTKPVKYSEVSANKQVASHSSHYKNQVSKRFVTSATIDTETNGFSQAGKYKEARAVWAQAQEGEKRLTQAESNINKAASHWVAGRKAKAIEHWQKAIEIYQQSQSQYSRRRVAEVQTDQAQAYLVLGQVRQAKILLERVIATAQSEQEKRTETVARGILGNAYAATGDYERALAAYQQSLSLAEILKDRKYIATALNNSTNALTMLAKRYMKEASSAEQAEDLPEKQRLSNLAQDTHTAAKATAKRALAASRSADEISQINALLNYERLHKKSTAHQQAASILARMADSSEKAMLLVKVASNDNQQLSLAAKTELLQQAIATADRLSDSRVKSLALGELGHLFELSGELAKALELSQQAQFAAQQTNELDSLYRWQWQSGRIYQATGKTTQAIAAYKQAVSSLQEFRSDITSASKELQFDVQERVEPVYRELIGLILENSAGKPELIKEALKYSDLLKLSELQNFFGDECLEVQQAIATPNSPNLSNAEQARISSIILKDKTYIVLQLADGTVKTNIVTIPATELVTKIKELRGALDDYVDESYLNKSKEIYELLLRPLESTLNAAKPQMLTFVNDGILRNIPMAVLHDGKQYLIEKYTLAVSLNLVPRPPEQMQIDQSALIFGLATKVRNFSALPNVIDETQAIEEITGGSVFLDRRFTVENLEKQVRRAKKNSTLHLATHGRFSGRASTTFIQAYDRQISIGEFEQILSSKQQAIDLLILSACQTAAGDSRSTLGIAGLAARNGVNNIVASLWSVDDAATATLMKNFYEQAQNKNLTVAQALRDAQIKAIADPGIYHPLTWSAFVLVSN